MIEPSDIRVGDAEREQAVQALGEHMSAGRLDIDEYGERTARVTAAKTRGEVTAVFQDLPEPRPKFSAAAPVPANPAPRPVRGWQERPLGQRLYGALVPVSFVLAFALFFTVARHFWPVFLLPVAVTLLGAHLFGDDWARDRRAWRREQRSRRHP